jgi:hypothetical protein
MRELHFAAGLGFLFNTHGNARAGGRRPAGKSKSVKVGLTKFASFGAIQRELTVFGRGTPTAWLVTLIVIESCGC